MVVPCDAPMVTVEAGRVVEFPYRYKPRYQDVSYRYSLLLTAEAESTADIRINDVTVGLGLRVDNRRNAQPLFFDVDLGSQSTTEGELKFLVKGIGGAVTVEALMVEALPRSELDEDSSDLGADRFDFWARQPIAEDNFAINLLDKQNNLRDSARRSGAFAHSWGTGAPRSVSGGAWDNLFDSTTSIRGRLLFNGQTKRAHSWKVKVYCSDGTTAGEVRVTNDAMVTTIAVPTGTTSATWLPASASQIGVATEDNTTGNGERGGSPDDHTFEARVTAGAGSLKIETVSVWEA